jgi:hypothetical protein
MALLTTTEAALGLPGYTGANEDSKLSTLIDRAGELIARHCGYPPASAGGIPTIESTSYTLYLRGRGGSRLPLGLAPVTAIASIYDDPSLAYDSSTLLASTDYTYDGDTGEVWLLPTGSKGEWTEGYPRSIKATITAGYVTVPDAIKQAAVLLVRHWWNLRHVAGKMTAGGKNTSSSLRDEDLPASVRELLASFILPAAWMGMAT